MKVRTRELCKYHPNKVGEIVGFDAKEGMFIIAFVNGGELDVWKYSAEMLQVVKEPPTSETIDRFLALYNEYCHVPSADLKIYPTAKDYIKAKWNEDKAKND